ncbi:transposase [Nesterenkonia salmonea]|nr:transposase [Nesterenkonia salmonea]
MRDITMPNKYSDEFKADAVALYQRHPELSYRQAAEDLGVSQAALKVWVRQARRAAGKIPTLAPEAAGQRPETAEEELARLRVEVDALRADKRSMRADLDRVTEERRILQKATKYFAAETTW